MLNLVFKVFFILFSCLGIQDEPVMAWSEENKLSWSDFKAKPKSMGSAVATTASGITFGFSIKERGTQVVDFTVNIDAHFYPEQSWYIPERATRHVLGHEQLHFDITELYARKFRKRTSALQVSNSIKNELKALHKAIQIELAQMQDLYDSETDYSRNIEKQAKWQMFVITELEKLSRFKQLATN